MPEISSYDISQSAVSRHIQFQEVLEKPLKIMRMIVRRMGLIMQ